MFTRKTRFHITAWGLFIAYESIMGFIIAPPRAWWEPFAFNVPEIGLFYALLYILRKYSKGFVAKAKWSIIVPATLVLILLFCLVAIGMRVLFSHWQEQPHPQDYKRLYFAAALFRGIYLVILSMFLWLAESTIRSNKLLALEQLRVKEQEISVMKLQQEALISTNQLHKAQIKPHILFNTLNFIYSKIAIDPKAGKSVLLLTDIMRFALDQDEVDALVTIEKEWQQVENYISLQRLRFEKAMFLNVTFVNLVPNTKIPPLVILTLLENMFVHGNLFDATNPALFHLSTHQNGWKVKLSNKKRAGTIRKRGHNIGLTNAYHRLSTHYGKDSVTLNPKETEQTYSLELIIVYHTNESK